MLRSSSYAGHSPASQKNRAWNILGTQKEIAFICIGLGETDSSSTKTTPKHFVFLVPDSNIINKLNTITMKTKRLSFLALSALLAGASIAHADIILSDSFAIDAGGADYNTAQLGGQSATVGTTGYTGDWSSGTSLIDVTTGGLTHSAMTGTAQEGRVFSNDSQNFNARVLYRDIDYTTTPLVTGTYYFSALFNKSAASSGDMLVGFGDAATHQTTAANYNTFGIVSGGALSYRNTEIVSSANFAVDTTYIGVMEINYDSAGTDSIVVTFYNEAAAQVGSQTFSGLDIDTNLGQILVGTASQGNNNAFVDEFRFGTALSDVYVVPEPSAFALIGLGSLVLLRRRRA